MTVSNEMKGRYAMRGTKLIGIAMAVAMAVGASGVRADELGGSGAFSPSARHAKAAPVNPSGHAALNPQPLPPHPGDPDEKSGIIIVGGKNKPAKPPVGSPSTFAPRALDNQH